MRDIPFEERFLKKSLIRILSLSVNLNEECETMSAGEQLVLEYGKRTHFNLVSSRAPNRKLNHNQLMEIPDLGLVANLSSLNL